MLEDLHIKNFALIESVSLDFSKGFTVFTGETGAGKSILIGAISFLLGGKAGTECIRTGAGEMSVCATFLLSCKEDGSLREPVGTWLSDHGIETDDGRVMLRRILKETGKSSAWIQGVPATRSDLSEFSSFLIDIHGQHEHQSLMKVAEHRRFLDAYANIESDVLSFTALYADLIEKRRCLEQLECNDAEKEHRREMLEFAVKEISDAKLHSGEDEQLAGEEQKLSGYEQMYGDMEALSQIISGEDVSLLNLFRQFESILKRASAGDRELVPLASRGEALFYEISDIVEEIRSYKDSLVYDPSRLAEIQERTALFYKLKKKYASSVQSSLEEVIAYGENAQKELDSIEGSEGQKQVLRADIAELEKKSLSEAHRLSSLRRDVAGNMAEEVEKVLSALGMKNTRFEVFVNSKDADGQGQKCGPYGIDDIEFMIAPNVGAPLLPLAKIASGGELSRIMLALKTVLAEADTIDTLIFDEIDTGIGGEIAVSLGEHIEQLALKRQILCITHLAGIAVFADSQIKIEKNASENKTLTEASVLDSAARVEEIARMLSGDSCSRESLEYARSLLNKHNAKEF